MIVVSHAVAAHTLLPGVLAAAGLAGAGQEAGQAQQPQLVRRALPLVPAAAFSYQQFRRLTVMETENV